jgi:hypothetical protein
VEESDLMYISGVITVLVWETGENHGSISQDSPCPGQNPNAEHPEYVITRLTCSDSKVGMKSRSDLVVKYIRPLYITTTSIA